MPFTLLHFGPGLLIKSFTGKWFSFTVFAFTNVLIDVESLYYLVQGAWPVHRFLHSYVGATVAIVFGVMLGRPICQWALKLWNNRLSEKQKQWLYFPPRIPWPAAISGAALGAYSHVFLDSIMHTDMRPLMPFTDGNWMLHLISLELLYLACVVTGLVGMAILSLIVLRTRKGNDD